jgi:hypothetical protein
MNQSAQRISTPALVDGTRGSGLRAAWGARRQGFRGLHESGCFVMPNLWDIGCARYLQARRCTSPLRVLSRVTHPRVRIKPPKDPIS